jgi:NADH-quinone oxidoreductase subunit F
LPKEILSREVRGITDLGVEIKYNMRLGKNITTKKLFADGYSAVLMATGAHNGQKLRIDGEDAKGVVDGVTFLRSVNLKKTVKVKGKVTVIGGGNVAIDAARSALRLGADEVSILYRREKNDMPAYKEEVDDAEKEGIRIYTLVTPNKIVTKGKNKKVAGVECTRMKLGKFDKGGRRTPEPVTNSEFIINADMVIAAIGQTPDLSYLNGDGVKVTKSNTIEVNKKTLSTEKEGIFAAGDNVRGPATAVEAVGDGKKAAMAIDEFLGGDGRPMNAYRDELINMVVSYNETEYQKERERVAMPHLPVTKREKNFTEVVLGYERGAAVEEAKRCLHCYLREPEE